MKKVIFILSPMVDWLKEHYLFVAIAIIIFAITIVSIINAIIEEFKFEKKFKCKGFLNRYDEKTGEKSRFLNVEVRKYKKQKVIKNEGTGEINIIDRYQLYNLKHKWHLLTKKQVAQIKECLDSKMKIPEFDLLKNKKK